MEARHERADMIQVYKVLKDEGNVFLDNCLTKNVRIGRKNSSGLYNTHCNLKLTRRSFAFRVVDNWNKLSDEVVLSGTVEKFKNSLDKFMRCSRGQ